jgi:hypothetical protein
MREATAGACYFCGSKNVALRDVGISMGMGGDDYSFCETCLTSMTADDFGESSSSNMTGNTRLTRRRSRTTGSSTNIPAVVPAAGIC